MICWNSVQLQHNILSLWETQEDNRERNAPKGQNFKQAHRCSFLLLTGVSTSWLRITGQKSLVEAVPVTQLLWHKAGWRKADYASGGAKAGPSAHIYIPISDFQQPFPEAHLTQTIFKDK